MPAATLRRAVALVVSAVAFALCGAAHAQSTSAQSNPVASPQRAESTTMIQVAPDVTLRTRVADPALLQASRQFDALDRDSSGFLDTDEAAADATLAADFERADGNGNGRIDRDEYTARLRR